MAKRLTRHVHPLRSLRVAVVGAFIIIIFLFAVVFLFVLFFVWFFSEDDIGSYRSIRVWDDAFITYSVHAQMVRVIGHGKAEQKQEHLRSKSHSDCWMFGTATSVIIKPWPCPVKIKRTNSGKRYGLKLWSSPGPEERLPVDLDMRVGGIGADGRPFSQHARAHNISAGGALLCAIEHDLKIGDTIGVQAGAGKTAQAVFIGWDGAHLKAREFRPELARAGFPG